MRLFDPEEYPRTFVLKIVRTDGTLRKELRFTYEPQETKASILKLIEAAGFEMIEDLWPAMFTVMYRERG